MPEAMVPLATTVLAGAVSSVTLNIPTGYRDLQVVVSPKGSGGNGIMIARYDGDTNSNYPNTYMYGEGSAGGASATTATYNICSLSSIGTTFNPVLTMYIMDYGATDRQKVTLIRYGNNDVSGVMAVATRWTSLPAISSITFAFTGTDSFAIGSTFKIFGVLA